MIFPERSNDYAKSDFREEECEMKKSKTAAASIRKGVLGRGLKALIPTGEEGRIHMLDVSEIKPSKHQARKRFNSETIKSLADTIKQDGVIQPLIVSPAGTGWRLIAGERRLRASKEAGLKEIPAIIKDSDEFKHAVIWVPA